MIGAEEARRASSRRGGGEGGRRGGVGDKNNLKEACVRVFCVCESDKRRSFEGGFCQSVAASSLGEISRATRGGLFDLRSEFDQKRVKQGAKFACLSQQERPHA